MLKILFNRSSPVVRLLEIVGVVNSFFYLRSVIEAFDLTTWLFLFLLLCYLFIRVCDLIHWYPGEPRGLGIEVHFKKALVPTSYILSIASLFCLLSLPIVTLSVVILADILMLIIAPVNGILLWFHCRDHDPMPINYFSLNKYLRDSLN